MANTLPVKSSAIFGEEEWTKSDGPNVVGRKVRTLKDLVAPQTIWLFTINYDLVAIPSKPKSRRHLGSATNGIRTSSDIAGIYRDDKYGARSLLRIIHRQ
jgi:hypothetical protein